MTTRIVYLTLCLVAMATTVTSECSRYINTTRIRPMYIPPSLELWEGAGLIAGIGGFALLLSLVFLTFR